ncbi:MAG: TrkA family potassium uptake protein [Endomicrobium sp.]|jgi:trk system potassium uptake protein TrkA|nr:TrkA family potassium uptake protein [Endomicrobium sp.]
MPKKQFGVIGLGTFGSNVAKELEKKGMQVLAIDIDMDIVNKMSQYVTQALAADAVDEKAMKDAGIADCDTVIVSIGESVETSILATLIVKELGVKNIIVKCVSQWHSRVAAKIGADKVIYPEFEMAKKLVENIVSTNILSQIELSKDYDLIELIAPKIFWGSTIKDSGIRSNYGVNVIALRRRVPTVDDNGNADIKEEVNMVPCADDEIMQNDVLVVIGSREALSKIKKV